MYEHSIKQPMALDKSKSSIEYLRMDPADNGVIISWTEKTKKAKTDKNTYDNYSYKECKLVYDVDNKEKPEEGLNEAFSKFRELWERSYKEMKY